MNRNELLTTRHDLFVKADTALQSAKRNGKDLSGDDRITFDGCIAQMREIDAKLDAIGGAPFEREREFPALPTSPSNSTPRVPVSQPPTAFGRDPRASRFTTLRDALSHATPEQLEEVTAFAAMVGGDIRAAANLVPTADGAFLIPSILQESMERSYAAFAPVISVCRVWGTDNGEPATFPVLSDSESAVQLASAATTGADATVTGDTPPTALTGPKLGAYKVSSKPVFIPRETIGDSPIDIVGEVIGALLARIIRYENLQYTTGDGTTEAEGFITNCTHMAAGAVALDLDIALDLAYTVPPLYRPNGVYMASDVTIKYLRKLKTGISGDKRSLWKDAFEEGNATLGTPAKLHGYPIYVNNDMDSVATDGTFAAKSPLVFGDFKRFVVRQAELGSGYLYNYQVPAKDGRAVIMFRRSDSKLLVSTAICKVTVS